MPPSSLALQIPARPERLARVRRQVRAFLSGQRVSACDVEAIVLALDEACTNIIRHAYGGECDAPISIDLEVTPEAITVLLADSAPRVDKDALAPGAPAATRPGGLGLHFIHQLMDAVEPLPEPDSAGNRLRLWRRRRNQDTGL